MKFTKSAIMPALTAAFRITEAGNKPQPPFDNVLITQQKGEKHGEITARNFYGEVLKVKFPAIEDECTTLITVNKTFLEYINTAEANEVITVDKPEGETLITVSFGHSTGQMNTDTESGLALMNNEPEPEAEYQTGTADKIQLAEALKIGAIRQDTSFDTSPFSYLWLDKGTAVAGCAMFLAKSQYSSEEQSNLAFMILKTEPLRSLLVNESGEVRIEYKEKRARFTGENFQYTTTTPELRMAPYQQVMDESKASIAAVLKAQTKDIEAVLNRVKNYGSAITLDIKPEATTISFSDIDRVTKGSETVNWGAEVTEPSRVIINRKFLSRLLRVFDKDTTLEIKIQKLAEGDNISKKAVFISSSSASSVIMPMKGE